MVKYTRKRRVRNKKGGKYIASGTYGCVFGKPPLKCIEDAVRTDRNVISKLMTSSNAEKEYNESEKWKEIDPGEEFSLHAFKTCIFDSTNIRAENKYTNCKNTVDRDTLLFYKNGGPDIYTLEPHPNNYRDIFKAFHPLLEGLAIAHKNNIVHTDIKRTNIVAELKKDNIKLRFIDFGLSIDLTTITEYDEMYTNNTTIYPYWPFEFGTFNKNGMLKNPMSISQHYAKYNYHRTTGSSGIGMPKITVPYNTILDILNETDFTDINTVFKKCDVYSIGTILCEMLYIYFRHSIIQDSKGIYFMGYANREIHAYSLFQQLNDRKLLPKKQSDFHNEIYENVSKPLLEFIVHCTDINPATRYTASEAADHYKRLLPLFDTYFDSQNIESGLKGQKILNMSPEHAYVKTP